MFLRTLNAIHEDIVSNEGSGYSSEVANRVKDGMRENCLPAIADAWYSILQLHTSAPQLVANCLNTISLFVCWVDISLVANPRFMGLLLPFMSTPALHEGACSCLAEIVAKRMDSAAKLAHLERLQMISLLSQAHSSGIEISEKFASLVSALAMELLDVWDKLKTRGSTAEAASQANQAAEQLKGVLPLLLSCLSADDVEVSESTLQCAQGARFNLEIRPHADNQRPTPTASPRQPGWAAGTPPPASPPPRARAHPSRTSRASSARHG